MFFVLMRLFIKKVSEDIKKYYRLKIDFISEGSKVFSLT